MANTIDLSSLKSGRNIEGKELRDFGNGKKEFDPSANGIFAAPEPERKSDQQIALEQFDAQLAGREAEAKHFNELLDKYDGVMTEEEYLKETGKGFISDMLNDHTSEEEMKEIEELRAANRKAKEDEAQQSKTVQFPTNNNTEDDIEEDFEDDDLEKEILSEEEDNMPIARGTAVTGDFTPEALQYQQNPHQPQVATDVYNDPNLTRHATKPAVPVKEEKAEEEVIEDEILEEETSDASDIVLGTSKIQSLPKTEISTDAVASATGKVIFEAPEQKEQVIDEDGMTEEEKDLAALDSDSPISIDDEDEDEEDDNDAYWRKIGAEYAKKVKPIVKKLDLSAAVVSSEPVTVSTIITKSTNANHYFKWMLINSGRPFTMKSFTASELNTLGAMAGSAARAKDIIKALWDHIVDGKGTDFDQWCKVTSHKDLVHLWFGVYGACFEGANHVPYVCPKCKKANISQDVDIMSMVQYKDSDIQKKAESILAMNDDPDMGKIMPVARVQISDSIVIDFKDPSVYDILTTSLVDNNTRQKYAEGTAMLPYISNIYYIVDTGAGITLRPLSQKTYPGNEAKTLKRRAIEYSMIIRSLNSEEYRIVSNYITQMTDGDDGITYIYPATTCDHCHSNIPLIETNPSEMVFTRHRLALMEG